MEWFYTRVGHFLIGLSDALSPRWIKEVLFYTDRRTKKILNESIQLQIALRRSITQAGIVTTIIPFLVRLMGWEILGWILTGLSLIFTYGYLIFYNMEVTQKAMKVIVYRTQQQAQSMPQLDRRQKYNLFVEMSYLVQSFIFQLIFYTPMNLLLIVITMFEVTYSPWILVIMDSFFNAAFYYFRKWPYDKYNVAFLEKQMAYCLGYGFPVSLITNWLLPTSFSIGGYLLISQYMIVNALCHSPPKITFTSFTQIIEVLRHREKRRQLPSAYNHHRDLLNKDKVYRQKLIQDCLFMSPFFNLTQRINIYVQQKFLNKKFQSEASQQTPITPEQKLNQQPSQQKKPNLEVIKQQSQEFKVPFADNTTAFEMQFQDEDEKEN